MKARRLNCPNFIPLLKPPKLPSSASALRPFSFQTQTTQDSPLPPPQLYSEAKPIQQILSLLQTTKPDDWPSTPHLHRLLHSASPMSLLKVARQLGSSQNSLLLFNHVKDDHALGSDDDETHGISTLSFIFQGVLEHAAREEGHNSPAKLRDLYKFSKEQKAPLSVHSATLLIKSFGQDRMLEESIHVFDELRLELRNIHVVNSLLNTMPKSGKIDGALKVVDEMLHSELGVCPDKTTLDARAIDNQ